MGFTPGLPTFFCLFQIDYYTNSFVLFCSVLELDEQPPGITTQQRRLSESDVLTRERNHGIFSLLFFLWKGIRTTKGLQLHIPVQYY
jgi:hypothetical protein